MNDNFPGLQFGHPARAASRGVGILDFNTVLLSASCEKELRWLVTSVVELKSSISQA